MSHLTFLWRDLLFKVKSNVCIASKLWTLCGHQFGEQGFEPIGQSTNLFGVVVKRRLHFQGREVIRSLHAPESTGSLEVRMQF